MKKTGSPVQTSWFSRGTRILTTMALGCGLAASVNAEPITLKYLERNVDFVTGATGGIGPEPASITITGASGQIRRALLFWHGIGNPAYDNPAIQMNGNPVTGSSLGDATTNCWGTGTSRAFVADVTPLVTGNGVYTVSNMATQSGFDCNGASLIVLFDDGNPANDRDLAFFAGNDSNISDGFPGEDNGWNATLPGIPYTEGSVFAQFHCSDGQTFPEATVNLSTASGSIAIPDDSTLWDGQSVFNNENHRASNGALWDVHNFDITSIFNNGPGDYTLTLDGQLNTSDCLGLVLMLIDLRGGSAPPVPEISKTGPARAQYNQEFTYTINYSNPTTFPIPDAVITDVVPNATAFISATNGGTFDTDTVTWNVGTINPGTAGSVSFNVLVTDPDATNILNDNYGLTATGLPGEVTGPPVSTIILQGLTFEFSGGNPQDWYFVDAAPFRTVPNHESISAGTGYLRLQATDNTNCFGFWESPLISRVDRTRVSQTNTVPVDPATGIMLARWRFFSDQANASVPQFRARVTDMDFQQTDMLIVNSQGTGDFSPSVGGKDYSMLVWPNPNFDDFRLEFDILGFDPADAAAGIIDFDFVNLRGLESDEVPTLTPIKLITFDTDQEGWTNVVTDAYDDPAFEYVSLNGDGALCIDPNGSSAAFGFWDSGPGVATIDVTKTYYVRFRVASNATDANKAMLPSFRCRLNDGTLQGGAYTRITSKGDASRVPTATAPIDYYVPFQPDPSMAGRDLLLALDMMNFLEEDATDMKVYLLEVEIFTSPSRF